MKTAKTLQDIIDIITRTAEDFELDLNDASVAYRLKDKLVHAITFQSENCDFLRIGEYKGSQDGKLTGDLGAKKCVPWAAELMKRNNSSGKTGFLTPTWLT